MNEQMYEYSVFLKVVATGGLKYLLTGRPWQWVATCSTDEEARALISKHTVGEHPHLMAVWGWWAHDLPLDELPKSINGNLLLLSPSGKGFTDGRVDYPDLAPAEIIARVLQEANWEQGTLIADLEGVKS